MPLDIKVEYTSYTENFLMGIFMKSVSPSYTLTDSPVTCTSSPPYFESPGSYRIIDSPLHCVSCPSLLCVLLGGTGDVCC